jgi:hypothetical protein
MEETERAGHTHAHVVEQTGGVEFYVLLFEIVGTVGDQADFGQRKQVAELSHHAVLGCRRVVQVVFGYLEAFVRLQYGLFR